MPGVYLLQKVERVVLTCPGLLIHSRVSYVKCGYQAAVAAAAEALLAVSAANIHYPPACRYKPFLSMAVQCNRDRLYL